jgi:putative serine protease PepD
MSSEFFADCKPGLRNVTATLGTVWDMTESPILPPYQPVPPGPSRERPPRRTQLLAGVAGTALLVGGGAGVAGAAAWDHWAPAHTSSPAATSSGPSRSTAQVDSTPVSTSGSGSFQQVAARVLPSVVEIDVSGQGGSGSGSGIILSSDGEILTNNHVAEVAGDGGTISIAFNDGTHAAAKILGTDPLTDTAVLKAEGVSGLTPATIGRSSQVAVGQSVVAVGSPFGLDATVTSGIVSALDRPVDVGSDGQGNTTVYPAIQTDAAINPGNSGGPLVDAAGRVVGINSSIQTTGSTMSGQESGSIGLGFAIPIDEVMPLVDEMAQGQTPTHARLGITVESVSTGSGAQVVEGAAVRQIGSGSAAQDAGLRSNDVITKVDDHLISSSDALVAIVRSYRPGDEVTVTYTRGG